MFKLPFLDINVFLQSLLPGLAAEIAEQSICAYIGKELGMQIVTGKRTITVGHAAVQKRKE